MKRIVSTIVTITSLLSANADIQTDKKIVQISRDTTNYISVDVRGETEEATITEATRRLTSQIADYIKTEYSGESISDFANISRFYNRLTSKIEDNRYRVMLYIKKSDLVPKSLETKPVSTKTDTIITLPAAPLHPVLARIAELGTAKELTESLKSLRTSNQIKGAAAFPVAFADNFYIAVTDGNKVVAILHFIEGQYVDVTSNMPIDIKKYNNCTGYWFTL